MTNITYNLTTDNTYTISAVITNEQKVVLPNEYQGIPVLSIAPAALANNYGVYDIIVQDGIQEIGTAAFMGCSNLQSIKLPKSIKKIGECAFAGCNSLKRNIILDSECKEIGAWAFEHCDQLDKVVIGNKNYEPRLFSKHSAELFINDPYLRYTFTSNPNNIISIPEGVTKINSTTFRGSSSIKEINLPDSIGKLSKYAFADCKNLKSIHLSKNLKKIGAHCFEGCLSLTDINACEQLEFIDEYAFKRCLSLRSLHILNPTVHIGDKCFDGCTSLTLYLPDALKSLKENSVDHKWITIEYF